MAEARRVALAISIAALCLPASACSRRVLGVLVDLPQPTASAEAARPAVGLQPTQPPSGLSGFIAPIDTVVPEIERTLDPDSVIAMLPRDHAGNLDWMAALRHEVIRPRDGVDGPRDPPAGSFEFGFDFYFQGPNEMFDAYFPHSAHTEWMDCAQCHPRIFRTRPAQFTMADVFAGKYCGECHGTVAYPVMTGCERCHTSLPQPPNRAQPELIGTIEMRRASEILAEREPDVSGADGAASLRSNASGVLTDDFPVSHFPHWVHRIRYRCKTCHMEIFEPEAGANPVTMVQIAEGQACGRCHDGDTAFAPEMDNCDRCHVPPQLALVSPTGAARRP